MQIENHEFMSELIRSFQTLYRRMPTQPKGKISNDTCKKYYIRRKIEADFYSGIITPLREFLKKLKKSKKLSLFDAIYQFPDYMKNSDCDGVKAEADRFGKSVIPARRKALEYVSGVLEKLHREKLDQMAQKEIPILKAPYCAAHIRHYLFGKDHRHEMHKIVRYIYKEIAPLFRFVIENRGCPQSSTVSDSFGLLPTRSGPLIPDLGPMAKLEVRKMVEIDGCGGPNLGGFWITVEDYHQSSPFFAY
ncbi:hypothetical protein ACOME3_006199 [Neoechinorhynchus agilis]